MTNSTAQTQTARQIKTAKVKALIDQLTFGVEVEQEGLRYGSDASVRTKHEMNALMNTRRHNWRIDYDGSIGHSGCEYVTGIMDYPASMEAVQEGVRIVKRNGGRPTSKCGIHIHVDGSRFLRDPKALVRLIKLVDKYENLMYHALMADNRNVHYNSLEGWAKPVCQDFMDRIDALGKNPTIQDIERVWYNGRGSRYSTYDRSRYRLLNLHALWSKGTIEFRCFNGTLHAGRIKAYTQLSLLICAQALISKRVSRGQRTFDRSRAKYEVRTWLLQLCAFGEEFDTMRLLLTRHLQGNSAFHRTQA